VKENVFFSHLLLPFGSSGNSQNSHLAATLSDSGSKQQLPWRLSWFYLGSSGT